MDKIDFLIIGAGVVGLAVAEVLADPGKDIVIVDRNKSFGRETSSRNSEVIHGGMYYPTNSLKAQLCVKGRILLYDFCRKHNIPHKKTGKLIVAIEKEEIPALQKLHDTGRDNGVDGLRLIDYGELKKMEPNVNGIAALYSSETGIIDSHRLMQAFLDIANDAGVMAAFESEVIAIEKGGDGYKVAIRNNNETNVVCARVVINCAGLDSDKIAAMAGMDIKKYIYDLHYCKGQYFRLTSNKAGLIKGLVYPVPKPKSGGLGIHATVDMAGGVRLGPDDEYLASNVKDYNVREDKRHDFFISARKFLPFLDENDLYADTAGIRPKLQDKGDDFRDFVIKDEADKGFPGFINLIGIESPGLTASRAIAVCVRNLVERA
jgi:L-2-hydroxyglutarate oxidase LhgO